MSEKKKMLINVTHAEESRVAIVADGVLEGFEIETFDHKAQKGNIYKGRVESVQPGLQAAFVDIGGARAGFLPLDEVNFKLHPPRKEGAQKGRLENHLHKGQEILVQVVRDAYANKPPTLSTYFSLPGRYLVLTPHADGAGISRKLDEKQRDRLRKALDALDVPEEHGVIVRTAGASSTKTELARDLKYLLRVWETIEEASRTVRGPKLIYKERSLVIRTIRDLMTPEIDEILVDDPRTAEEIVEFFEIALPQKKSAVKLHQGEKPIFNKYNLEEQIENIFRRRVTLPSGGAVVFDVTEALTAVDVNSSKMTQEGTVEDTAFKANIEAAREIARQMRLRDLGGLVVIDFIDMRSRKNIRDVERTMKDELKKDKARWDATRISSLGLMEISRERLAAGKSSLRYTDCPQCEGTGSIKTVEAAAVQALRRLQTTVVRGDLENIEITVPPEVCDYLLNAKRQDLGSWEERYHTRILVKGDPEYIRDRCEMRTVVRERAAEAAPLVVAPSHTEIIAEVEADEAREAEEARAAEAARAKAAAEAPEAGAAEEAEGAPAAEGAGKKKRRRRRGGRKHRRPEEQGEAGAAGAAPAAEGGDFSSVEGAIMSDIFGDEEPEEGAAAPAEGTVAAPEGEGGEVAAPSKKRRRRRRRGRKGGAAAAQGASAEGTPGEAPETAEEPETPSVAAAEAVKPAPAPARAAEPVEAAPVPAPEAAEAPAPIAALKAEIPEYGEGHGPRALWWRALIGEP
ncbi:Rne/Rng family ribonuclease [bacterium]|nr:Rne/Rng family ribonuclease [bacterium]